MNPTGILYIEVPDSDSYYRDENQPPFQEYNTEHINHFDEMSLTQLFMKYNLITTNKKIIKPQGYNALYAIFSPRNLHDCSHSKYIENSQLQMKTYETISNVAIWGVGEFTYKLLPFITNITSLIDDDSNKIGKRIGNTHVISSTEFDYKSNIMSKIT